ncbi:MAG TPA: hypothetical protein DDY18_07425 [Flavobacterium sp.]|nr:hypothetical protein [Flavobacterium sp.]
MNKIKFFSTVFALLMMVSFANAQKKNLNMDNIKLLYEQGFSATPKSQEVFQKILADKYQSYTSTPGKTKQELMGMMMYVQKSVPNLKWEIKQVIKEGNQYFVRCEVTGNPVGDFNGVPTDGSKAFKIMTMHSFTMEKGQVAEMYFVEDWGTAMQQLSSK